MSSQYQYVCNDILESEKTSEFTPAAILAALIEIEHDHPGLLLHVLRQAAFAADGWISTSTVKDPDRSLLIQQKLLEHLKEIDSAIQARRRQS